MRTQHGQVRRYWRQRERASSNEFMIEKTPCRTHSRAYDRPYLHLNSLRTTRCELGATAPYGIAIVMPPSCLRVRPILMKIHQCDQKWHRVR